jgi:hypothetical protein
VATRLKRSLDSGPGRTLTTAASTGYGLIKISQNYEYFDVEDRGRRLVSAPTERERQEAAYDALFANDIFAGFVARFSQRTLPANEVLATFLEQNFSLSADDAKGFAAVVRENLVDFGLTEEVAGRLSVISREMALERFGSPKPLEQTNVDSGERLPSVRSAAEPPMPSSVSPAPAAIMTVPANMPGSAPEFHFNIQIHLPSDATPEAYDAIFKSIATHLLGRGE